MILVPQQRFSVGEQLRRILPGTIRDPPREAIEPVDGDRIRVARTNLLWQPLERGAVNGRTRHAPPSKGSSRSTNSGRRERRNRQQRSRWTSQEVRSLSERTDWRV